MSIAGKRVQKQIRQPVPREMVRDRQLLREDETRCIDAARRGFLLEIRRRCRIVVQEPKHGAVNLAEQTHPAVEYLRIDLVALVEAAKDEAGHRKIAVKTADSPVRNLAFGIIDLVAVRQIDEFFAE